MCASRVATQNQTMYHRRLLLILIVSSSHAIQVCLFFCFWLDGGRMQYKLVKLQPLLLLFSNKTIKKIKKLKTLVCSHLSKLKKERRKKSPLFFSSIMCFKLSFFSLWLYVSKKQIFSFLLDGTLTLRVELKTEW